MKKLKILTLLFVLALAFNGTVRVSAAASDEITKEAERSVEPHVHTHESDHDISFYIAENSDEAISSFLALADTTCTLCGYGTFQHKFSHGPWLYAGTDNCVHGYRYGHDTLESRSVIESLICDYCHFGEAYTYIEQRVTSCFGYNASARLNTKGVS